ncbi:MAG: TIGR03084 family metal-binding protein, partial [Pseudomonadota bacterium]
DGGGFAHTGRKGSLVMQQATDFLEESEALNAILIDLSETEFDRVTQFKDWTINDVLQHLHFFNDLAMKSAFEPEAFTTEYAAFTDAREVHGGSMVEAARLLLNDPRGQVLRKMWIDTARAITPRFVAANPKERVKWAGPDMSVRSSITARQMETWAHGQEVFDVLGLDRDEHDRMRNIAHLGVSTYGWTFVNRGEAVPEPMPHVRLTAPSGAVWEWGEASETELITGDAVEFCQVTAQTRNIADTRLQATGPNATRWMAIAQCFAGPPNDPPAPGSRTKAS